MMTKLVTAEAAVLYAGWCWVHRLVYPSQAYTVMQHGRHMWRLQCWPISPRLHAEHIEDFHWAAEDEDEEAAEPAARRD